MLSDFAYKYLTFTPVTCILKKLKSILRVFNLSHYGGCQKASSRSQKNGIQQGETNFRFRVAFRANLKWNWLYTNGTSSKTAHSPFVFSTYFYSNLIKTFHKLLYASHSNFNTLSLILCRRGEQLKICQRGVFFFNFQIIMVKYLGQNFALIIATM